MPFFSVIIPLFNKEEFIEATLYSVLNQSYADFEVIIVNDGSTDNSAQIISKFTDSRIRVFTKENYGAAAARNYGIEKSQSNYISFIDADDYWHPTFLQEMLKKINHFPDIKVFSAAIEIETSKTIFPAHYSIKKTGDYEIVNYFSASTQETAICTSCAVFNNVVFEDVGNFDTQIKSGQDTDMWIRIGLKYDVLFIWKILARYVYDENSLSKNKSFLDTKVNFSKFTQDEKTNPELKNFLDLNRFSLAIKHKIAGNKSLFENCYYHIDLKNLALKKRVLLLLPAFILKLLIATKTVLTNIGFSSSIFK
ncbi:glycosyltransferase family 2 protein [Flavobacterium sp. XN-5]|uniref:glycosyltransferase family 2 protein n=1 Tax=Flavobacterium sp. XN-5 TaxID=2599390 RepID=UPI0011CAE251|nr:glycosyltransferase family 2 protein [Flavobacterium sp. XN-5]NGY35939.1 glycosyltransferase family 2 protein [Flavobacterium sp. XN-5]